MASGFPGPVSSDANLLLIKSDRPGSMFAMSDENAMTELIVGTHEPDAREVDVKPLLHVVEDILNRATLQVQPDTTLTTSLSHDELGKMIRDANFDVTLDALCYTMDRYFHEIANKARGVTDAEETTAYTVIGGTGPMETTVSLFNNVARYSWDAKLVLTLAAFAWNYGKIWLLLETCSLNRTAKSIAILKQLPVIPEHSKPLKSRFDSLNNLIKVMMKVTRCVVEFKDLPSSYISHEVPALSTAMAHIPTAVDWTIRSVVACAAQIPKLFMTIKSDEYDLISTTDPAWELSPLAHKLNDIIEDLRKQLAICNQHIEQKRNVESFHMLQNLFKTIHNDNMKVLTALIYAKDDIQPLVDGSTKRRVHLKVLSRKNVLLLISGLDISNDELSILEQTYNESRHHGARLDSQYEVVWIPIVDSSIQLAEAMREKFESIQSSMPWFTVYHPSLIEKAVIRFIKEAWHFRNKPILVVLDPQGRVVCPNALHMMWIWGSNAFPFTSLREESLWREETWRLELLVDGMDPVILNWIKEGKYIFLYGGDDVEWVRKFTNTARSVAQASRIPLEMVYVGKSSKREQIRRVISTITVEKLSYSWQDLTMIWFFWTRLESMLFSKIQLGNIDDHDPIMQEIKKLISYDREGGWAVLSNGSNVVINGHGTTVLPTLVEYDLWKEVVPVKGFDLAFQEHHGKLHDIAHPCCRFDFPVTTGRIPDTMKCPECHRATEKFTTFLCCHDEGIPDVLLIQ